MRVASREEENQRPTGIPSRRTKLPPCIYLVVSSVTE